MIAGALRRYGPGLLAAAICAFPAPAHAIRLALLVGNDHGHADDVPLRYAESDATRLAATLTRVGGFAPDATLVLLGRTAAEIKQAIAGVGARLRATPGEHLVLVYYSGHADAQALHLGATSYPFADLKQEIGALPAATRVLILDACQAGVLTRAKGGHPGLGFDVPQAGVEPVRGLAILAATAGSELAQESDPLGGSVFTHHLQLGLSGLADRNHDGTVTLGEAFDYASERTVATTLATTTGPQHPTFRLDLAGRDELVLTRPGVRGAGYGQIRLDVPGWYFIRRQDGTIAAEVVSAGGDALALDPGPYEVDRRREKWLDIAALTIGEGQVTAISGVPTRQIAFGRMVRKGGGAEIAYGFAVGPSARTAIEDLGTSIGMTLAARADLSFLSLELRLGLGRARDEGAHLAITTWETTASVAALRAYDFGRATRTPLPTVAAGVEAGVADLAQQLDDGTRRNTVSPFLGPTALAELALGRRAFLRADVRVPVYVIHTAQAFGAAQTRLDPAIAVGLGAGAWF
jgi:hypothetical protein